MAFVQLDVNGAVIGMFGCAQNDPTPQGYAVIADADTRIATFQAAQQAAQIPRPTPLAWFLRLGQATQAALDVAARADTAVSLVLRYASGVVAVDVTDPLTIQSVQMLAGKGLLTTDEAAALLAP